MRKGSVLIFNKEPAADNAPRINEKRLPFTKVNKPALKSSAEITTLPASSTTAPLISFNVWITLPVA